jgi:hypothetical protein
VSSHAGGKAVVRYGDRQQSIDLHAGKGKTLSVKDFVSGTGCTPPTPGIK